jgi:hypothetical protein
VQNHAETIDRETAETAPQPQQNRSETTSETTSETIETIPYREGLLVSPPPNRPSLPRAHPPSTRRQNLRSASGSLRFRHLPAGALLPPPPPTILAAMNSTDIVPHQRATAIKRSKQKRVTGPLKEAIMLMIFGDENGKTVEIDEAARRVNLRTRTIRTAFEKVHVREFVRAQRQVLIAQASAGNILRVQAIRDQNANWSAAIRAASLIEDLAGQRPSSGFGGRPSQPGVVIIVGAERPALPHDMTVIEVGQVDAEAAGSEVYADEENEADD